MQQIKTDILINSLPQEVRVALVENGLLQEVHIERPSLRGIVGNIYKGKVVRVLPGMQAAFVNIGLDKAGFLHVAEIMPLKNDIEQEVDLSGPDADIRRWLYEGQEILVQVIKDPLGSKGARLTTHLSVASRYLVYMPDLQHIAVSQRLGDENERERLQKILSKVLGYKKQQGYIIRTVAEGVDADSFKVDLVFLNKLWDSVKEKGASSKAPAVIHTDLPLVKRVMRDMVTPNVERVQVDSNELYIELCEFVDEFIPDVRPKLEVHSGHMPIFEMYGVEEELQNSLQRKIALKSGGSLIIDQTEAMSTIDVNTGAYVGSRNLEETIFKTNMEAAQEIARQLRLRNLGGIIILDFIDMNDESHKEQVMTMFDRSLARDYAKTNVTGITSLGLIQMTRKRTHESLSQQLCEGCPVCNSRGKIKTIETVCYEIFREIIREAQIYDYAQGFLVVAAKEVVDHLMDEVSQGLGDLEATIGKPIKIQVEASYSREGYDIILL